MAVARTRTIANRIAGARHAASASRWRSAPARIDGCDARCGLGHRACGDFSRSLSHRPWPTAVSVHNLVALQLVVKCRTIDSQSGGSLLDIAVFTLKSGDDGTALQVVERNVRHLPILRRRRVRLKP